MLVLIVLVNLLIAIVDETYGAVKESEADQILRNKVGLQGPSWGGGYGRRRPPASPSHHPPPQQALITCGCIHMPPFTHPAPPASFLKPSHHPPSPRPARP